MNTKRIPVLMYHRIGDAHNDWEQKYCVSQVLFAQHMEALCDSGYSAHTIGDFISWLNGHAELPDKSILITFDDGFLGVYDYGLPVLRNLNWPAVVFLVSGLIGKQDIWCSNENPSGQTYPLFGHREIDVMRVNGFSFYSHSRSHADLCQLDDHELEDELIGSRHDLEVFLGEPVDFFAYPYGHYNDHVIEKIKTAGYKAAFSVQPGFNRPEIDPFRIRRIDVFGTDTPTMLMRKVSLGTNDGSWHNKLRYYFSRVASKAGIESI